MPHQLGRLYLSSCVEDFGLGQSFFLGHSGEDVLEFLVEDDVLDEDVGDLDSPLMHLPGHELPKLQGHLIPLLQQLLKHVVPADGSEGGEGQLLD